MPAAHNIRWVVGHWMKMCRFFWNEEIVWAEIRRDILHVLGTSSSGRVKEKFYLEQIHEMLPFALMNIFL